MTARSFPLDGLGRHEIVLTHGLSSVRVAFKVTRSRPDAFAEVAMTAKGDSQRFRFRLDPPWFVADRGGTEIRWKVSRERSSDGWPRVTVRSGEGWEVGRRIKFGDVESATESHD